jgi:hypothetical protein
MANHLVRGIALLTASIACTGCIAVWQNDHKIVASTGLAVTIDYDPLLLTPDSVANTARSECHKFERIAVLDRVRNGRTWTKIAEFRCEEDPIMLKGSIASLPYEPMAAGTTYRSLPSPLPVTLPLVVASVAAVSSERSKTGDVAFIDAIGPNWGITHRHVAKPQAAQAKAVSARAVKQSAKPLQPFVKQVQSLKAHNLPVASLKGSFAG